MDSDRNNYRYCSVGQPIRRLRLDLDLTSPSAYQHGEISCLPYQGSITEGATQPTR
jgi:hypothetical protein